MDRSCEQQRSFRVLRDEAHAVACGIIHSFNNNRSNCDDTSANHQAAKCSWSTDNEESTQVCRVTQDDDQNETDIGDVAFATLGSSQNPAKKRGIDELSVPVQHAEFKGFSVCVSAL